MTFQQTIVALLIAIVLAFQAGAYIERGNRPPSQIPQNLDLAATMADAKAAREEVKAYQALLTKAIDAQAKECPSQSAH